MRNSQPQPQAREAAAGTLGALRPHGFLEVRSSGRATPLCLRVSAVRDERALVDGPGRASRANVPVLFWVQ